MESAVAEDEKKPFDAELAVEDDTQPDPDETLTMPVGNGFGVWIVKIPKYLMERWSALDQDGVHLANLRVYSTAINPQTGRPPRIILTLPASAGGDASEPDEFELDMVNPAVENTVVVAETLKEPENPGSRARTTIMTGSVKHEVNARPAFTERYRRRMKERSMAANTPQRQIIVLKGEDLGTRGDINRLSSGVANGRGFSDLVKQKQKPAKGQFERMARMPKNQLLDALFSLFREREHWPVRQLRERTQQPEAYLKETLTEIAHLNRSGEHTGTWELKPNFREEMKGEGGSGSSMEALYARPDIVKDEYDDDDGDDDDDDDDEEDDMEEVAT